MNPNGGPQYFQKHKLRICKWYWRHETNTCLQFYETIRKNCKWAIIPVKSDGGKKHEMSGQGMQHFPKEDKGEQRKRIPKYWEYIAL